MLSIDACCDMPCFSRTNRTSSSCPMPLWTKPASQWSVWRSAWENLRHGVRPHWSLRNTMKYMETQRIEQSLKNLLFQLVDICSLFSSLPWFTYTLARHTDNKLLDFSCNSMCCVAATICSKTANNRAASRYRCQVYTHWNGLEAKRSSAYSAFVPLPSSCQVILSIHLFALAEIELLCIKCICFILFPSDHIVVSLLACWLRNFWLYYTSSSRASRWRKFQKKKELYRSI